MQQYGIQEPPKLDILDLMEKIRVALWAGDTKSLADALPDIDQAAQQVITARSTVGSRMKTIETVQDTMDKDRISNLKLKSQIEDVNFDKAASDLSREETVLRATLTAASKVIQPQLLDFLR
jgi:flagellar hook-associated protein 3 FlgL